MRQEQVKYSKLLLLRSMSFVVAFVFVHSLAYGQVDLESVVRLHYTIATEQNQWFEGYDSIESGSFSPYQSHRSGNNRDSAFVARTAGGESMIEWNTAILPKKWNGDSVKFVWVSGFGNNLGKEIFDLTVNDSVTVSFTTINDKYWSVLGKMGVRVSFTTVYQNSYGANFGYMVLTLHKTLVKKGKPVKIQIRGRDADQEIWYRLFAYRDALKNMMLLEKKTFYSFVEFIHMGEAILHCYAPINYSGKEINLLTAQFNPVTGHFRNNGKFSSSSIFIPRIYQSEKNGNTVITVAGKHVDTIFWNDITIQRLRAFMEEELGCDEYVFPPGEFPKIRWKNESRVENELGKMSLTITYYNKDFRKVTRADISGRYGAVIEGITPSGFMIKRYITLFCAPIDFEDYSKTIPIQLKQLDRYGIAASKWKKYGDNVERFSFGSLKTYPKYNSDAAIFLAGLNDLRDSSDPFDTPRIRDRQWWITLKRNLDENIESQKIIKISKTANSDSIPFLKVTGTPSSQYDQRQIENLRTICRKWAETGESPHVVVIAHKGEIILYESFGSEGAGERISIHSPMWMASITKLLTGVLMLQFVDQGLVKLDDPINRYLPEIPDGGSNSLTIRHLFTHMSGLQFSGEWASDWNPALENQIAHVLPTVDIGNTFAYHRVGYAIAGKIMERITGQAVPYLFQDYIFRPLGMNSAYSDNTYGGLYCSAIDLARLGQMLLNKGRYNGFEILSEKTFSEIFPKKLSVGNRYWGIGTSSMAGQGLSESAFGHGAASGTVFRVDPAKELIIISARNKPGKRHEEFENALIDQCAILIKNH